MIKLTAKQEKFCNKYLECGNASEAYRSAYDVKSMQQQTVWTKASKLLSMPKVQERLDEIKSNLQRKSDITKEKVLWEFAKVASSSIAHLHNTWIERKEFEELSEEQKASIKSISTKVQRVLQTDGEGNFLPAEVEFVKIELYDKLKALENINKMLGFEAPGKMDVTSAGQQIGAVQSIIANYNGNTIELKSDEL